MHTYFNYEFTMVLTVNNPYSIDDATSIIGQTSNSLTFEVLLKDLGTDIESVVM